MRGAADDRGDRLRIAVITASTRRGRAGEAITAWFLAQVADRDDLHLDHVDLARTELPTVLPDFDTETTPETVAALGVRLAAADGFVVVTPEYNHSFPASLKNAIDWYDEEWHAKPVAFVSYGGRAAGSRAVEQLRQVFPELRATTIRDGVGIDLSDVDDRGWPAGTGADGAAEVMVDELAWWATTLREGRRRHPDAA